MSEILAGNISHELMTSKEEYTGRYSFDLDIYNKKFIVLQFETSYIEMYQVKTFYYQSIQGIREFRYSMSQQKSFLYYPNGSATNLEQVLKEGLTRYELYRVLEQIKNIIENAVSYLLNHWSFVMNSQWVMVNKDEGSLRIELLYVPIKKLDEDFGFIKQKKQYEKRFLQQVATAFNQIDDMDGYYYFMRSLEPENEVLDVYQCITVFLDRKESQWIKKK